jgi:hypothetical protein
MSASEVSHGYYKQIRPIGVNPDLRPRLFLATLVAQPLLLNTGHPNIGHSVALKAWYQDGYTCCYYWTCYPGKLDVVLYRMKFARLGKGSRSEEE